MREGVKIDYQKITLPDGLLNSFAKVLVPQITEFYNSEEGQAYYKKWLDKHPEYSTVNPDARASGFAISRHIRPKTANEYNDGRRLAEDVV